MQEINKKLLVVEDMEEARELIEFYFERKGYTVFTACCAEEALPIIKEQCPDVMLLDVILPSMSGIDLLRMVRQFNTTLKVIMVSSALIDIEEVMELKQLNFTEFIPKPVSFDGLESSVRRACAQAN
jgi:two-component system response regulator (stage 0 sporulation protein F)